jgi:hypothetical protein
MTQSNETIALDALRRAGLKTRHPEIVRLADHEAAAHRCHHSSHHMSEPFGARPDLMIMLNLSRDGQFDGALTISDTSEPKVCVTHKNGARGKYTYYLADLLRINSSRANDGLFYLNGGPSESNSVFINHSDFFRAIDEAFRFIPPAYGSFEIHWVPADPRLPF